MKTKILAILVCLLLFILSCEKKELNIPNNYTIVNPADTARGSVSFFLYVSTDSILKYQGPCSTSDNEIFFIFDGDEVGGKYFRFFPSTGDIYDVIRSEYLNVIHLTELGSGYHELNLPVFTYSVTIANFMPGSHAFIIAWAGCNKQKYIDLGTFDIKPNQNTSLGKISIFN
jgi:hypothetical protein